MVELDAIVSNRKLCCIDCGDPITLDNCSGWEAFLPDGKTTQPICKFCDGARGTQATKVPAPEVS